MQKISPPEIDYNAPPSESAMAIAKNLSLTCMGLAMLHQQNVQIELDLAVIAAEAIVAKNGGNP